MEALKGGHQIILLRKGGLADKGKVFALEDTEFFLYPTYLHQQVEFVKRDYLPDFIAASTPRTPDDQVRIDTYAVAVDAIPVASREALERLDGLHVWNHRFLDQRLQWKPEAPAWVVLVRAYRLPRPVILKEERRYRGCRSWVTLDQELATSGATSVIADNPFAQRVEAVKDALAGRAPARPR